MRFERADFCNFGSIIPHNSPLAYNYSPKQSSMFSDLAGWSRYKLASVAARLSLPVAVT